MRATLSAFLLGLLLCLPATAQNPRTLSLERGGLYVDGQRVADAHVPPTLDLRRVSGQYSFSGADGSTFLINGLRYRFSGKRLVLDTAPERAPDAVLGGSLEMRYPAASYNVVTRVGWTREEGRDARLAEDFALQQEFALEASADMLAHEIRSLLPGSPTREVLVAQLREVLREAFEVKQRNHLREIEALEAEIESLRRQHAQRNGLRDRIVERRLGELIGVRPDGLR